MSARFLSGDADEEFERVAAEVADAVEREMALLLDGLRRAPARLVDAMRHAALGGGKRMRPLLVSAASAMFDVPTRAAYRVGAAIELVHSYSLAHDDLPAMDDAALRRGRPSCHVAFGDATAILAGDALQALALEAIARGDWPATAEQRLDLVRGLARAAGADGMCGGQELDLQAEGRALDLEAIAELQRLKTGALIAFSVDAGCILGRAGEVERDALRAWAEDLGLAFQIKDDLLDEGGDEAALGKAVGQDAARGKATFVAELGAAGASARLDELRKRASTCLDILGPRATVLRSLFDVVINRSL